MSIKIFTSICLILGLFSCDRELSPESLDRQERQKVSDDAVEDFSGLTLKQILDEKYQSLNLNCEFNLKKGDVTKLEDTQKFSADLLFEEEVGFTLIHGQDVIKLNVNSEEGVEILNRQNRYVENGYIFDLTYSPTLRFKTQYEVQSAEEELESGETITTVYESRLITKDNTAQLKSSTLFNKNNYQLECKMISVLKPKYEDHYKVKKIKAD